MRARTMVATVGVLASLAGCTGDDLRGRADRRADGAAPSRTSSASPGAEGATPTPEPTPSFEVPEFRRPPRTDGLVLGGDISWPQCPKGMGIPEKRSQG